MPKKLVLISVLLFVVDFAFFYMFEKQRRNKGLEIISNMYMNKEISLYEAEFLIKRNKRKIIKLSYLSHLATSVNACFLFSIPFIFSYYYSANISSTAISLTIAALAFMFVPKKHLEEHEKFKSVIDETNQECISLLKEVTFEG